MYLYHTTLYKTTTNVVGAPADNATNLSDFETNYKSSAVKVSDVSIAETTFRVENTYSAFKALVASPLTWADVKYTDDGSEDNDMELFLLI